MHFSTVLPNTPEKCCQLSPSSSYFGADFHTEAMDYTDFHTVHKYTHPTTCHTLCQLMHLHKQQSSFPTFYLFLAVHFQNWNLAILIKCCWVDSQLLHGNTNLRAPPPDAAADTCASPYQLHGSENILGGWCWHNTVSFLNQSHLEMPFGDWIFSSFVQQFTSSLECALAFWPDVQC